MSKEDKKIYNIEGRSVKFGENVIDWVRKLSRNDITKRLIHQAVGASTSIGVNYCEADCAESNKDFIHKMSIANKESKESNTSLECWPKSAPNTHQRAEDCGRKHMN